MPWAQFREGSIDVRYAIRVLLDAPPGITAVEMAEYVATAVKCWSHEGNPYDPLWDIDNVRASCRGETVTSDWS